MFLLNVSEGKSNYSQRKAQFMHVQKGQKGENKINWGNTCNSHALCMSALYSNWKLPTSDIYEREPDAFSEYVVKEVLKDNNWWKQKMPVLWKDWYEGNPKAYSPLELHEVLAHYFNEWVGCSKADTFRIDLTIRDFIKQLYENRLAIATSVAWCGLTGHIISVVGFEASSETDIRGFLKGENKVGTIKNIIIDDPFGFPDIINNKYDATKSGNDVKIPLEYFWKHCKDLTNSTKKYGHILCKPVSLV